MPTRNKSNLVCVVESAVRSNAQWLLLAAVAMVVAFVAAALS